MNNNPEGEEELDKLDKEFRAIATEAVHEGMKEYLKVKARNMIEHDPKVSKWLNDMIHAEHDRMHAALKEEVKDL